jgi:hypothetical protein
MKHPEEVSRLFSKPDEEVLQQSDLKLGSFNENKLLFVERFPQFGDPFAAGWAADTATARAIPPDYVSVSNQTGKTEALKGMMVKGRNCFQKLLLYTQLAFPGDAKMVTVMGQPQYHVAHRSQLKLPVLLKSAHAQASIPEIKNALMSKGMKESEINDLSNLAEQIISLEIVQQNAKNGRTLDANKRITALNLVWEKMSLVCQCAKLLFQEDAVRYNLFLVTDGATPISKPVPTPGAGNP